MTDTRHAIRPLDPLVIGKIAAGEVVERPAFAIKELVENSVDAGATAISIEIRDGGLTYFRVADNGCGIAPEDIRMAFARHATSKLRTADELTAIHTLGFRGEALASIAAVSRVELTTRRAGDESGTKAVVEGGVISSIQAAASPEGTSITVRDLFYNTPARRKFLKKPATEAGLVSDLVMRLIFARPDISFRLHHAERQIYHSSGNGNLRDAMFSVFGRDVLSSLVEVKGSAAGCAVSGFVGVGEAARSARSMQTFILNGRYVRNTFLSQAVEEGCRERVMIGKYPVCALHLTMPFEAVDVNVHPNKLEVRFQDERLLMAGLSSIVRSAFEVEPLRAAPVIAIPLQPQPEPQAGLPVTDAPQPGGSAEPTVSSVVSPNNKTVDGADAAAFSTTAAVSLAPGLSGEMTGVPAMRLQDGAKAPPLAFDKPRFLPTNDAKTVLPIAPEVEQVTIEMAGSAGRAPLQIIGVAWLEYVLAVQEEMLYIIDQHAAHERILYEQFTRALDQQTASQRLLVPQVVQLTHREHAALTESLDDLQAAGFVLEDFGDRAIQVRAVPLVLGMPQIRSFLGDFADSLSEYRALPTQQKRRDAIVKLACRKAVKAGDPLSKESIERLIDEMRETGAPPTCPHGRPIVIVMKKSELDKRFRRIP